MSPVNLPLPILLHAIALTLYGLYLTFGPSPPGRASEATSMLGVTTTALGVAYLSTSYMPIHENAFLYASVPVRMLLGSIAGIKALVSGPSMNKEGRKRFWAVFVYDGLGGALYGYFLGTWSGKPPGVGSF